MLGPHSHSPSEPHTVTCTSSPSDRAAISARQGLDHPGRTVGAAAWRPFGLLLVANENVITKRFHGVVQSSRVGRERSGGLFLLLQSVSVMTSRRVSLFVTCIVDQLFPNVGMAMAGVLERLGYELDFPEEQTCCGQPAFNSGYRAEARAVALVTFWTPSKESSPIVVPSGSCGSMAIHHFPELFAKEPEALARAHALAGRMWEFSTFPYRSGRGGRRGRAVRGRRHLPRQLPRPALARHQGFAPPPAARNVRGLELREVEPPRSAAASGARSR